MSSSLCTFLSWLRPLHASWAVRATSAVLILGRHLPLRTLEAHPFDTAGTRFLFVAHRIGGNRC